MRTDFLKKLTACGSAIAWVETQPDVDTAWRNCQRGDWMLWLLAKRDADRQTLVLAACECARLALPHVPDGEDRPRLAIETAERWAKGEATLLEVRIGGGAAHLAAANATSAAASAAGDAAFAAASATDVAAYAASAADAAYAAADAADVAYAAFAAADVADVGRKKTLALCADIVRRHFPEPPKGLR